MLDMYVTHSVSDYHFLDWDLNLGALCTILKIYSITATRGSFTWVSRGGLCLQTDPGNYHNNYQNHIKNKPFLTSTLPAQASRPGQNHKGIPKSPFSMYK